MTTLSKVSIATCQNFSALHRLISQPGVVLGPQLAPLVQRVVALVDKDYRDLNLRYIGIKELHNVCELLDKEKIDQLPKRDQIAYNRISLSARDKIREMNSPYKDKPFLELVTNIKLDPNGSPDEETHKKLDGIYYQLSCSIYDNPLGDKLVLALQLGFVHPTVFPAILFFLGTKLTVREFCLLVDKAFPEMPLLLKILMSRILKGSYCEIGHFVQGKTIALNLERIFGSSFNDPSYRLPPLFLTVLELTLETLKDDPSIEKTAYLDNRVAKVPDILMLPLVQLFDKVFSKTMTVKIVINN